jgi:uroporphyrin-3 C-methyltransferase
VTEENKTSASDLVQEAAADTSAEQQSASVNSEQPVVKPAKSVAPQAKAGKGGPGVVAVLALLLALLALAASGGLAWLGWQQQASQVPIALPEQRDYSTDISGLGDKLGRQARTVDELSLAINGLDQQAQQNQQALTSLAGRLESVANTDRSDWKLAELEYLLRLANQRLLTGKDVEGALSLLQSADAIVRELGYADLFPLRGQLAMDITALKRTPALDTEGIFLQLSALSEEIDRLVFFGPPAQMDNAEEQAFVLEGEDLETQLDSGWRQAISAFGDLVRITPRSVEIQPLLTQDQRLYLRARIRLSLEQAKNALLLRQPIIYSESLRHAEVVVAGYFEAEDPATVAVLAACEQLQQVIMDAKLPDISRSQVMMRQYLESRVSGGRQE